MRNPSRILYRKNLEKINNLAEKLGLDQDWVSELIWEVGEQYADDYYQRDITRSLAKQDPQYWHWFIMQWKNADVRMLQDHDLLNNNDLEHKRATYEDYHSHLAIAQIEDRERKVHPWHEIYYRTLKQ